VAEVVRDENHPGVLAQIQVLAQLGPVRVEIVDLGIGRVTLDHQIHRLIQYRQVGQVAVRQVAEAQWCLRRLIRSFWMLNTADRPRATAIDPS
jgi:hypothetical protein